MDNYADQIQSFRDDMERHQKFVWFWHFHSVVETVSESIRNLEVLPPDIPRYAQQREDCRNAALANIKMALYFSAYSHNNEVTVALQSMSDILSDENFGGYDRLTGQNPQSELVRILEDMEDKLVRKLAY